MLTHNANGAHFVGMCLPLQKKSLGESHVPRCRLDNKSALCLPTMPMGHTFSLWECAYHPEKVPGESHVSQVQVGQQELCCLTDCAGTSP